MVGKANRILDLLKRTFESRETGLRKDLYISIVRTLLECSVQAWNPYLQGDIDKIERVQRRASRIRTSFEKIENENRLKIKRLSMTTFKNKVEISKRIVRGCSIEIALGVLN